MAMYMPGAHSSPLLTRDTIFAHLYLGVIHSAPCQLLIICMQIFRSLEMQIIHASQTDHIQHSKSASTFMWLLKWLLPNALSWPSKEGEHADSVI